MGNRDKEPPFGFLLVVVLALLSAIPQAIADERRAPAPEFSGNDTRGVFFENLADAFRGSRPSLSTIRQSASAAIVATEKDPAAAGGTNGRATESTWSKLISPTSLEDEIKRVRLHFDGLVTTPGAFKGGGYQDARLDLSVLATMFAIVNEHPGQVRWKNQAAAARDLLARTAFNCKSGSMQVYNEAKLRKADLQDLVSGSKLAAREVEPENDWSMVADRSPMMQYADLLTESLKVASRNESSIEKNLEQVRRESELLAALGIVFIQEGMDEWDDEDYAGLSRKFSEAAAGVTAALERGDYDAVRRGVSAVSQSCDACHEQYR